ncbi:hypothetical protein GOBAR_DD13099 [Gossypium barbadense]|nr:hypothetical protein GOBAR_DD13099 [Gossypium barbadense]
MDRQVAINAEGIIGKVLAIDCRDREGCWIEYIRPNQGSGIWRNGVEILKTREGKKELGGKIKSSAELEGVMMPWRSKEKAKIREKASDSCSLSGKCVNRFMKENVGKLRNRHKKHKGGNGEGLLESPNLTVRRKLLEGVSPFKAALGDQPHLES